MLVANKADMENERVVSTERGEELARQLGKFATQISIFNECSHLGFDFFETSAKENLNVSASFDR